MIISKRTRCTPLLLADRTLRVSSSSRRRKTLLLLVLCPRTHTHTAEHENRAATMYSPRSVAGTEHQSSNRSVQQFTSSCRFQYSLKPPACRRNLSLSLSDFVFKRKVERPVSTVDCNERRLPDFRETECEGWGGGGGGEFHNPLGVWGVPGVRNPS